MTLLHVLHARRLLACALLLAGCSLLPVSAQPMGGGMGGPGGGMGPGGHGPGTPPAATGRPERSLDDMLPPDPWRVWAERLQQQRQVLTLTATQQPAFDGFLRELDELRRLNSQRVLRAMRPTAPVVSAVVDVARDLRREADDARDWQQALDDLAQRWQALADVLSPPQRSVVETAYRESRQAGGDALPPPAPPHSASRPPPPG